MIYVDERYASPLDFENQDTTGDMMAYPTAGHVIAGCFHTHGEIEEAFTVVRAARLVVSEWDAYIGDDDHEGHDDATRVGEAIAGLRLVLP